MFKISKATFDKSVDSSLVKVTNHLDKEVYLTVDMIQGIAKAFKELTKVQWEVVNKESEDSPRNELEGREVAKFKEHETIRVVLHKYMKRPSISVGAYEKLQSRGGGWHRHQWLFAIYNVDDLDKLVQDLQNCP